MTNTPPRNTNYPTSRPHATTAPVAEKPTPQPPPVTPPQSNTPVPAPKAEAASPIKTKLFDLLSKAYPDATVVITNFPPGHAKLNKRGLVHAHLGAKVTFVGGPKMEPYSVAGMIPATAEDKEITELLARLADDKRRTEEQLTPKVPG